MTKILRCVTQTQSFTNKKKSFDFILVMYKSERISKLSHSVCFSDSALESVL